MAHEVESILRDELGFCPYVAVEAHSLRGFTDNIYRLLASADYVVFIDFAREELGALQGQPKPEKTEYRGSLFSHQELGIASYLGSEPGVDFLPFVQDGVKREGIAAFIQGNAVPFSKHEELPGLLRKAVKDQGWRSDSRRELGVSIAPLPPTGGIPVRSGFGKFLPNGSYQYHELYLTNHHRRLAATDCTVLLVGARGPSFAGRPSPDIVEMKFKHIMTPRIVLPAGEARQFDGVAVRLDADGNPPRAIPGILNPGHIDSEEITVQYLMDVPGEYELDIRVHSREFGLQEYTVLFHFDANPASSKVTDVRRKDPRPETGSAPPAPSVPVILHPEPPTDTYIPGSGTAHIYRATNPTEGEPRVDGHGQGGTGQLSDETPELIQGR